MGWEIHIFIQKKSGIYHGMEDFIMYKFTDDYLIGIDEIDNEHRRLFQMINEAIDLSKESSDISVIFMILSFRSKKKNMKHLQKKSTLLLWILLPRKQQGNP